MNRLNVTLAVMRIITGLFLVYHGAEVFDTAKMNEYLTWDSLKQLPAARMMVYLGKGAEFVGGILLVLGFFTRIGAAMNIAVMFFITFFLGNGKFWSNDQHPFLLAMLCMIYLVGGSVMWGIDNYRKHR